MHKQVLESGSVNMKYYRGFLVRLRATNPTKRPDLWRNDSRSLQEDNFPVNNALSVKQFSPSPSCDFCLFPKPESASMGPHFQYVDKVKAQSTVVLKRMRVKSYCIALKGRRHVCGCVQIAVGSMLKGIKVGCNFFLQ